VTLCLDVPESVFAEHDVTDEIQKEMGYHLALIPAAELNRLGAPRVYDHFYAGSSRRELVQASRMWQEGTEEWKQEDEAQRQHAQEMRDAIAFFDRIGWLTPVKLQEEAEQQKK
jgi:hypothetical protein